MTPGSACPAKWWRPWADAGPSTRPGTRVEPWAVATEGQRRRCGHGCLSRAKNGASFRHPSYTPSQRIKRAFGGRKGLLVTSLAAAQARGFRPRATPPPPERRKARIVARREALRHGAGGVVEVADWPPGSSACSGPTGAMSSWLRANPARGTRGHGAWRRSSPGGQRLTAQEEHWQEVAADGPVRVAVGALGKVVPGRRHARGLGRVAPFRREGGPPRRVALPW
jgi:hypothetical protein